MQRNATVLALTAGSLIALGVGGYFMNERIACNSLEQDYLDSAAAIIAHTNLASTAPTSQLRSQFKRQEEEVVQRAGRTLFDLGQRCGKQAADKAHSKAQALVLDQ